jgi:murein DD-endopeptidase MepM/ murein hydrolase activator NlpD
MHTPVLISLVSWLLVLACAPGYADRRAPADGVWPLDPRPQVVETFDPPDTVWGPGHRGVDLAGRPGQPVRAALPGRISFAGRLAGRGVVVVRHGVTRTTYEPVTASVSVGDVVAAGDVIGRLQVFGSHCFPRSCLHWGLIEGLDHYLDPLTLVGAGPVRLLPLDGGRPVRPSLASIPVLDPGLAPDIGPVRALGLEPQPPVHARQGSAAMVRGTPVV